MISVSKQNSKVLVQSTEKAKEKEPEKRQAHFYRFFPNREASSTETTTLKKEHTETKEEKITPLANDETIKKDAVSSATEESNVPASTGAKPVFSLPNNQILSLKKLMAKPDEKKAPFIELKIWALEMFIIRSGMAIEDILSLRICNVDTDNGYIILQKNGGDITKLSLHSTLIPVLDVYLSRRMGHPDDYLFCNEQGGSLSLELCKEQIQNYNEKRGVLDMTIDQLRRAYI